MKPSGTRSTIATLFALGLLGFFGCDDKRTDHDTQTQSTTQEVEKEHENQDQPPELDISREELEFDTASAMYAANEEWLTFACELPDGQKNIGSAKAVEMYYYSMYGLGQLLFRSGNGAHMVHNPLFAAHVKNDEDKAWYQKPNGAKMFMDFKMAQFHARTGARFAESKFPPKNVYPIYLEYDSGTPEFTQPPELDDFATLRWKESSNTMTPAAWGQSMSKQVLWARDFFTNPKTIDGVTYFGNNKDDGGNGFRGASLIAMAITKSFALKETLAYDARTRKLGSVNPAKYDPADGPKYYPHEYSVTMEKADPLPPKPKFEVTDSSSHLFDVASLLWAESEFYFFTDPTIEDDYDALFGDPKWNPNQPQEKLAEMFKDGGHAIFPKKPHKLSKGIAAVNLKNMKALHFDAEHKTLVDSWSPESKKGSTVSVKNAGMAMIALANTAEHFHDVPKLKEGATKMLGAQAKFLASQIDDDGSIPNTFELGDAVKASTDAPTLTAQAFAVRGLLAAHETTNEAAFRKAAERIYGFMNKELWAQDLGLYRSSVGAKASTYDGYNVGATLGALRELALARKDDRREVVDRLDTFFTNVVQRGGFQLAEIGKTGEPVPSLEKRKKKMAQLRELKRKDPSKATKMKSKLADSDRDGVPKPPFVEGTKYGAAPVSAAVTIKTP